VPFVLDASVAVAWCLPDEQNAYADAVIEALRDSYAVAPCIWQLEVSNALLVAERRKRLRRGDADAAIGRLAILPIRIDAAPAGKIGAELAIAREAALSTYDASYLLCAAGLDLPLATIDAGLRRAAATLSVPLFEI
jgi:predicted nucleic acid-binding protein